MIETLWITNPSGDTLELNLRSSEVDHGLLVFNMTGLGPPKATVSGEGGPGYDGIRASFVRTDARHMVLTLAVTARGDDEEIAKQLIYDFFPIKGTIGLGVTTGAKNVYTEAIVETNEFNQFAKVENAVIGLFCPDPYFLDIIPQEVNIRQDEETNVVYTGDVSTGIYMKLIFGGACDDVYITNDNGGQAMYVDLALVGGAAMGDKVYIDTRVGQKSVIHETWLGTQTNLLSGMGMVDDWLQLHPGDNNIEVAATVTPHADIPTNLVEYWPLSEENDQGALGVHADNNLARNGVIGKGFPLLGYTYPYARDFVSGNEAYFENLTPAAALCPIGDFAISFWANVDVYANDGFILEALKVSPGGFHINTVTGTRIQFGVKADGAIQTSVHLDTAAVGTWALYTFWFDLSEMKIWGQMNLGTEEWQNQLTAPSTWSSKLSMGGGSIWGDPAEDFYDGRLQSVMLYDKILTTTEKTFLYNSGNGRSYAETTGKIETKIQYSRLSQGV